MRIEMLVIGDEVLDGRIVDSNSQRLARALAPVGLQVSQRAVVTDDIEAIVREARACAARGTGLCVVSGGLGPTSDDVTAEAFAALGQVPLVRDAGELACIEADLRRRGREVTDNQRKQADRPQGARVLANGAGSAPGFAAMHEGCEFVALPGVPAEFDRMVDDWVVGPRRGSAAPRAHRTLYCYGLAEAEVDRRLAEVRSRFANVRLQFRIKFPEVHVGLHAAADRADDVAQAARVVEQTLQGHVFAQAEGTDAIGAGPSFAAEVLALLQAENKTVALAESCTGGLVCDMLTDVPGSSANVHVGVTAYANAAKHSLLGVTAEILTRAGAVSEEAVLAMAAGVRKLCDSDYGIAISGIAGPGGATAHKPVGLIWFGLATRETVTASNVVLPFDRRRNKLAGAYIGLDLLRRHLLASRGRASAK